MLTLPTTPELESLLETEAAKRGLHAPEYALLLIESCLPASSAPVDEAEAARLAAIDELMGMGVGCGFSSADVRKSRNEDLAMEEERYQRRFGRGNRPENSS
jgi:hypothetical protein